MTVPSTSEHQTEIVNYYHRTEWVYRMFWNLDQSLGIHFGFWEAGVSNLTEAIIKQNEVMAAMTGITSTDKVLDAGCGVGGSSIWLAKHIGCDVTGITITPKQVIRANGNAANNEVSDKVRFEEMDYLHTNFADETFDVIWALESVCHAPDKKDFIKEASRLLKPGGRLIIADYFQIKQQLSKKEHAELLLNGFNGWAINSICDEALFRAASKDYGFEPIQFLKVNDKVMPSFKKLLRKLYFWLIPGWLYYKCGGITKTEFMNAYGSYNIARTLGRIWDYYIFTAIKK
jgi:cyclopropane fatty-acyl-phospholipid synthase-like methyltransferase